MSLKKILLLAIATGGLFAFLFEFEVPRQQKEKNRQLLLAGKKKTDITNISLTQKDKEFSFRRKDEEEWEIEAKPYARVDDGALNAILFGLESLKVGEPLRKEDLGEDLSVFGLEPPELTLGVKGEDVSLELQFGKKSEYLSKRYLRVKETDNIFLVSETLFTSANKSPDQFRDATPFEVSQSKSTSVSVHTPDTTLTLVKKEGTWFIDEPYKVRANDEAVSEFFRKLRSLTVISFIDDKMDSLSEFGLDSPDITLEFGSTDQKITMAVQEKDDKTPKTFIVNSERPVIYEAQGSRIGDFNLTADMVYEREVFTFDPEQATKVTFSHGDKTTVIEREQISDDWRINGNEAEKLFIESFVKEIAEKQVDGVLNSEESSFEPVLTINITTVGGSDVTLKVGPPLKKAAKEEQKQYPLIREGWSGMYWLTEDTFEELHPRVEALTKNAQSSESSTVEGSEQQELVSENK